ncbi:hypothetical protein AURDEDRAFT_139463 [Auricularia subglabra TFB-10046 SS5]|nr:hypothetical protein AURDEDRAFT_139463 [Auricularia subglabra TFB-10046 SS5]
MHIILTGATGLVGYGVLQHCLASPTVTRLSILSRRDFELPSDPSFNTSKARIIVHKDFASYPPALLEELKGAHGCVWAQGISQTEVPKDEYVRITYDYPLSGAKAFSGLSDSFNFVYVSGEGADPTEKTYTLFGKIKGRAETHLIGLQKDPNFSSLRAYNVRPAFVDPGAGNYHRPRPLAIRLLGDYLMGPAIRLAVPSFHSPTNELSKVLVDLALGDGRPIPAAPGIEAEGRTVRSKAIRKWASIWGAQ